MSHSKIARNLVTTAYDIGQYRDLTPLSSGFANINAQLQTDQGFWLYRAVIQKNEAELQQEIRFMNELRKHDYPAAFPVPKTDGSFFTRLPNGQLIVLYDYLDGSQPALNAVTAAEIGKAAARLHTIPPEKWMNRKNDLTLEKCRELARTASPSDHRMKGLLERFDAETEKIHSAFTRQPALPKGIVHGDLYPDNTIFENDTLVGIIDFEEFCYDTLLFDVGNAIQGFCYRGLELQYDSLKDLVQTYNSIRPFEPEEIPMIPWYIRWAALAQSSWHLRYGLLNRFNDRQFNRVMVLMNRNIQMRKSMKPVEEIIKKTLF